jgi:hypothetical protein
LVIFASCPLGLNAHGRFIGLEIVSGQQLLGHGPADGPDQFTNPHHPSRVARDSSIPVSRLQDRALSVERYVVSVFAYHRVNQPDRANPAISTAGSKERADRKSAISIADVGVGCSAKSPNRKPVKDPIHPFIPTAKGSGLSRGPPKTGCGPNRTKPRSQKKPVATPTTAINIPKNFESMNRDVPVRSA